MTKILIIGAGAIGAFYGSKLAQSGAEVTVVCRSDYEFVKKNGFKIKSHWQQDEYIFKPKAVLQNITQYNENANYIIVTTKVLEIEKIIDSIKKVIHQDAVIVLLQNGIDIEKPYIQAFPQNELISALAFVCVSKTSTGNIFHQDYGRLVIGNYKKTMCKNSELLANLWQKANVPCAVSDNIIKQRWQKLVWNAPFNPISVLSGGKNTAQILANSATESLVRNIMQEVCILAQADNCELDCNIIEKNISDTKKMKPYKTSMLLDFEAKRPMEIEAILGNAINFAKSKNIAVPHLASLYGLLV